MERKTVNAIPNSARTGNFCFAHARNHSQLVTVPCPSTQQYEAATACQDIGLHQSVGKFRIIFAFPSSHWHQGLWTKRLLGCKRMEKCCLKQQIFLFHQWQVFNSSQGLSNGVGKMKGEVLFTFLLFLFLIVSAPFPKRDFDYFLTCEAWHRKTCQYISGDTFQLLNNQKRENVGHQSWKRHWEWGRKNTAAKIEVRNAIRVSGKRARESSQWTLLTSEGKDLKNCFYFWRVHTFVKMTTDKRTSGLSKHCSLSHCKTSWFDPLLWKAQIITMSNGRDAIVYKRFPGDLHSEWSQSHH